ncbi:MAG: hypothetical protein KDD94_12610 [Calditrichaeota bacterium]|nr:hypothetical protein [Calditrichota bacterium]
MYKYTPYWIDYMFKEFHRLFNQNPLQTNIWETDEALIAEYSQRLTLNNERLEKRYLEELEQCIQEAYETGRLLYNHIHTSLYSDNKKVTYQFKLYSDLPISGIAGHLANSLSEQRLFSLNEAFAIIKTIANMQNEINMRFFDMPTFEKKHKIIANLSESTLTVLMGEKKVAEITLT